MDNYNNNTYETDIYTSYETVPKAKPISFLETEKEVSENLFPEGVKTDFAGALRLLAFSDKIIQPFEKKFIIDSISLGLSEYSEDQKLALAEALLHAGKISHPLADQLLLSSGASVQKILLEKYPYHSERVLISLALKAPIDILLLIAVRKGLSSHIARALFKRDEIQVTRNVLLNKWAHIDSELIKELIGSGVRDEIACMAMLDLPDIDPALALTLFWDAPSCVRLVVLKRFLKSHVLVESHFGRMKCPHLRNLPLFSALGAENLNEDSIAQGFEGAIDYFRKDQHVNAIRLLSLAASLPQALLEKISTDTTGEAMVVFLKAFGLERVKAQYYLLGLSQSPLAKDWAHTDHLEDVYDTITWGEARMAVSYWLWQVEAMGPYQAAEEDRFLENISSTDFSELPSRQEACGE